MRLDWCRDMWTVPNLVCVIVGLLAHTTTAMLKDSQEDKTIRTRHMHKALSGQVGQAVQPSMEPDMVQCPAGCHCDWDTAYVQCPHVSVSHLAQLGHSPKRHLITHLSLRNNHNMQTITNAMLHHFPNLEILDLGNMRLHNLSRDAFFGLDHIRELSLDHNNLDLDHLEALTDLTNSLQTLNLQNNNIASLTKTYYYGNVSIVEHVFSNFSNLVTLQLSYNAITTLPQSFLVMLPQLESFNISHNRLRSIDDMSKDFDSVTALDFHLLRIIDVSFNAIATIDWVSLSTLAHLVELRLDHNLLTELVPNSFRNMHHLHSVYISYNPLIYIPRDCFIDCVNLQHLEINYMPKMMYIDNHSFRGLNKLRTLSMSHNPRLHNLHAHTLSMLTSLVRLDLSNNAFQTIYHPTFHNLTALQYLGIHGNPWSCDCELRWLNALLLLNTSESKIVSPESLTCANPRGLSGQPIIAVPLDSFSCSGALVLNHTKNASFAIGKSAVLNCLVEGSPHPALTWTMPTNEVLHYEPAYVNWGKPSPHELRFHDTHHWHHISDYFVELPHRDRVHVLKNGSLYIDYVQRIDAGRYTCMAHNDLGNQTVLIHFRLNYHILRHTIVMSLVVGFCFSACFFVVGLIVAVLRYVGHKCSREERQKRKGMRQVLKSLEAYKTAQFGRLSAYKSAKIDQLAAFKSAKVDKLRNYKNITLHTLVQYLERMREHYLTSVKNIRENCASQADKLRDNYTCHVNTFKDYGSHQFERMRDNYNGQMLKIRDYGANQLERLREQYKQQQQYVLKILELMDVGSCMTVIEAECLRTDSMLFDPDLNLDLDTHPVHVLYPALTDSSASDYETAGSRPGINNQMAMLGHRPPHKRRKKRHKCCSSTDPQSSSTCKHKRPHRRKKHRHKRKQPKPGQNDQSSTVDHDAKKTDQSSHESAHKKRIRKVAVPKALARLKKSATTESDFHDCVHSLRELSPGKESSVYMTGQSEQSNTEYDSTLQSPDQTPDTVGLESAPFPCLLPPAPSTQAHSVVVIDPEVVVIDPTKNNSVSINMQPEEVQKESFVETRI